jgi:hypothetical protein
MSSYDEAPTNQPGSDDAQSLSARRARLRGSLAKSMPDPYANPGSTVTPPATAAGSTAEEPSQTSDLSAVKADAATSSETKTKELNLTAPKATKEIKGAQAPANGSSSEPHVVAQDPVQVTASVNDPTIVSPPSSVPDPGFSPAPGAPYSYGTAWTPSAPPATLPESNLGQGHIDLLTNIDQSMSICAMNLATLQKSTSEQTEVLEQLAETMRTQTFSELGLNLSSLMESLSAALEPMKAVGELVPSIDQLVSLLQAKEGSAPAEPKLTPEQLVMNLADRLSTGQIDPWTFKCAYMAVFPADHPADLLHRLVDLLGTQRLSGELFRAAYDAVQAAEPPPMVRTRVSTGGEADGSAPVVQVVQDDAMLAELESLRQAQQELQRRDQQREEELATHMSSKESEMNERWQEFTNRHEELVNTLKVRDERLQERETELAQQSQQLAAKDSENQVLKAQMEELREQTQEMVKELQKQMNETRQQQEEMKTSAPKPTPGFFDVAGGQAQQEQPQQQPPNLFDSGPARPLFQNQMNQHLAGKSQTETGPKETAVSGVAVGAAPVQPQPSPIGIEPQMPQPPAPPPPAPPPMPQLQAPAPPSNQAVPSTPPSGPISTQPMPRPPAAPNSFVPGSGSYGTGVRAQVFEVIVRQALAGAPWREICAGPMQVNNISPDEVEAEVKRRQALLKK